MKKITLLFLSLFLCIACEPNDDIPTDGDQLENQPCNFQGRTYTITSYLYDIPVDLDNDQVYSNEIIDQTTCYVNNLDFDENDDDPEFKGWFLCKLFGFRQASNMQMQRKQ